MTQTKTYKVFELVYPFQTTAHIVYQEQKFSFTEELNIPSLSYNSIKKEIKKYRLTEGKPIWHLN